MKRIIALLLALLMLISLSSCSALGKIGSDYKFLADINSNAPLLNDDESFDIVFNDEIKGHIEKLFSKCEEIASSGNFLRFSTLASVFTELAKYLYYIGDQASLCYVEMSLDTADPIPAAKYNEINEYYVTCSARMTKLYKALYESSLSSLFFAAWTDDQIAAFLKTADLYTDEFLKLSTERNVLITEYTALNESDSDFNQKTAVLYEKIVAKNREIAECAGYTDYPTFAYENIYMRDYSPNETAALQKYMREYLIPVAEKIAEKASYKKYETIGMGKYYSEPQKVYDLLSGYYYTLGAGKEILSKDWVKNTYYTYSDLSAPVAFTTYLNYYSHPICYFGPDNGYLATYVHEQGHYNAFNATNAPVSSVDLCEVHSQGNEWLYMAYLAQDNNTLAEGAASYMLLSQIVTFTISLTCDAYEQYVYENPTLTANDYDDAFINVSKEIGSYQFLYRLLGSGLNSYWHRAIVANSLYYISYATSQIPAIELYVTAMTADFELAAEKYTALLYCNPDDSFGEALNTAGLSSPLSEEIYNMIYEYFMGRSKK